MAHRTNVTVRRADLHYHHLHAADVARGDRGHVGVEHDDRAGELAGGLPLFVVLMALLGACSYLVLTWIDRRRPDR